MMLIEDTPVADTLLPLDACKDHLRLGSGFSTDAMQDTLLLSFLRAALAAIEGRTGKALITRTFRWKLYEWRDPSQQVLPIAPVVTVDTVQTTAQDGSTAVVPATSCWLEQDSQQPLLRPAGFSLPTIPHQGFIEIIFSAGLGGAWVELPPDLQQAVLMLAAHYYEFRNDAAVTEASMPFGVSSLIERYRSVRVTARAIR
jgi:uncharacterized phiE125 gp8 family phage protein